MSISGWIIALISIGIVLVWWFFAREKIGQPIPNPLMKRYARTPWRIRLVWGVRLVIFFSLFVLWIDPIREHTEWKKDPKNEQIIIALDISNSMKTDDILPSRIEKAKSVIDDFIRRDDESAIGYMIFAGRVFLMSPPTRDQRGLRDLVASTTTDTIDQSKKDSSGTNIGDALLGAVETLSKSGTGAKTVILVTDGRANTGIDPEIAAEEARKNAISVYTVGVGSISGSVLSYVEGGTRKYFYTPTGEKLLADIDETALRDIATRTGGAYFHAGDEANLFEIFEKIESLVSLPDTYSEVKYEKSDSLAIVIVLTLLIGLEVILTRSIRQKYKSS